MNMANKSFADLQIYSISVQLHELTVYSTHAHYMKTPLIIMIIEMTNITDSNYLLS